MSVPLAWPLQRTAYQAGHSGQTSRLDSSFTHTACCLLSPYPHLPFAPSSTCQAVDEVLPWMPQETGAAQSSLQSLSTKDRMRRGRWLRREAEPSLLLQGTHQGPICWEA